ncbi:MAG: carbohydrate porin [Bacteroidales bacterium]|nr:carbohydrate porin [Bacteroidales bacterium]
MSIAEAAYTYNQNGSVIKAGFVHHSAAIESLNRTETLDGNWGTYIITDNYVTLAGNKTGVMFKCGYAPANRNMINLFTGAALNLYGFLAGRPNDFLGMAVAYAGISKEFRQIYSTKAHETAIELTYRLAVNELMFFQPNLQYVINPGADKFLDNAFVGLLRFGITF